MQYSEPAVNEKLRTFLEKLNSLDFGPLAYKLMNPEDRPGFSLEQTIDAITKYKGFLFLYYANQGKAMSPSRYIDYVWHTHIMDTELYFVQTAMLFGHYLHHFPFFGKRNAADEKDLLAAADFTRSQALNYFGWDGDEWCGTGRKPKGPHTNLTDLVKVIFPAGIDWPGMNQNPDIVTIQAGNFRHTIEHSDSQANSLFSWRSSQSQLERLAHIIKLPIWVIVCMPAELDIINRISTPPERERLLDISKGLVEKRLAPKEFSGDMIRLQIGR